MKITNAGGTFEYLGQKYIVHEVTHDSNGYIKLSEIIQPYNMR